MAFTFLHTADWHIDKPFNGFDANAAEQRAVLRQARLDVVSTLAQRAAEFDAEHVLVGGDIFDRSKVEKSVVDRLLQRLAQHERIIWHLIPGNHDPAERDGVWDLARAIGLPGNVFLHIERKPIEIAEGVVLLPSPWHARLVDEDLTAWMDDVPTPPGTIRIGLAHGGVINFDRGAHGNKGRIAIDRDQRAGLAYLALGDWHGLKEISPRVWYSGSPECDDFDHSESGQALIVTLTGAEAPARVQSVRTGRFQWQTHNLRISSLNDLEVLQNDIRALGTDAQQALLKLAITGHVTAMHKAQISAQVEKIAAGVFFLKSNFDGLVTIPDESDLQQLGNGELREIAERLYRKSRDADDEEAEVAKLALENLLAVTVAIEGRAT